MKSAAFCTLGCKVNQYETDAMRELFENSGYEIRNFNEIADIYIINTCTVTNMADRKSRQMLHRAKKKNPKSLVVAVGCYVQASAKDIADDPYIDLVIGNNKKKEIVSIVENHLPEYAVKETVVDIGREWEYEALRISKVSEHTRAYIKIQDGCNQFCSYCIIPYARGRVRSRQPEDIFSEVEALVKNGYKEIVLTGIHISSYGMDFAGEKISYNSQDFYNKCDALISLIEKLDSIRGLERIRLGSLEPRIITEAFANRLLGVKKLCPHFHLSLQSGCDETLRRMNRHYTTQVYKEKCGLLRRLFDRPGITTDVIVGFPGETEEEFRMTKQFLEDIHFSEMHIFKYSRRKGTRAAEMDCQVDEQIKTKRSNELIDMNQRFREDYEALCLGKRLEILIEESQEISGKVYQTGHSREYFRVAVETGDALDNQMIYGEIAGKLNGEILLCKRID